MEGMDGKKFVMTVETLIAQHPFIGMNNLYASGELTSSIMSQYRTGHVKKASMKIVRRAARFFQMEEDEFMNYLDTLPKEKKRKPQETKKAPVPEDEGLDRISEIWNALGEEEREKLLTLGQMLKEGKL